MKCAFVTILLIVSTFVGKSAFAANLRGQVVHYGNGGYRAVSGVRVDLIIKQGQSWVDVSNVTTGSDGFYFFMNIPPNTIFYIKVSNRYFPPQQPIINLNTNGYQDIAAIVI